MKPAVKTTFSVTLRPLYDHLRNSDRFSQVVVAEWLRRWTRNPLGSPRIGSNPIGDGYHFYGLISTLCNRKKPWNTFSKKKLGSTETRTRIAGFRVQSADHYTIEPSNLTNSANCLSNVSTRFGIFDYLSLWIDSIDPRQWPLSSVG
jgi:hypothetical protein